MVRLDHVRKEYGNFVAVNDADFGIGRGEFFSMLGPSGCGKTTTLRMIAGFEFPTAGRVFLDGVDVSSVPPYKRNVNTVFQQYALFPHMSVAENVAFGLRSKGGIADAELRRRVGDMLDVVRLGEFARRRPSQLSGGQQQRVALARALVNLPSALLLDEPLAALDLKLRQAMQIELKRIQREVGITFVFVTHDQEEALTMSDRIAVMSQGNVEQIGTPREIYNNPSSIFVAGFIGSANLLPGEIVDRDGDAYVVQLRSGPRVRLPGTGGTIGDPVTLMVRPERLRPSVDDPNTPNAVRGRITNVIFQGDSMRVLQELGDHTELVLHLEAGSDGSRLQPGDEVWTSWDDDAGYLMRGWSAIVGATTTDVDEVQATLDGKDAPVTPGAPPEERGPRINRRALLIGGGVAAVAAVGAVVFANAGDSSGGDTASADPGDIGSAGGLGQGADDVRILNWPAYIDLSEDGATGTVERFEQDTGINVEYSDAFNDNNEVFGTELEVYLGRGDPANYDIVCPTNWMAARLKGLGWLDPLPIELIPNFQNLDPQYLTLNWDKGAHYFMPWQAGYTGIAVNESVTGRPLTKFAELFEPEFRGQIAMFTEMRDTLGLVMLMQGNDPAEATEEQMNQALDFLEEQTSNGQIRAFTGNEYIDDIDVGNFAACVAWSGDILASSTNPDVKFVYPEEGAMSWFDTMVIPRGSPNAVAAARWMNYVYDPVQAAQITAYVQYVSPVVGVQDELRKLGGDAAALADNELLFPSAETKTRFRVFAAIPTEVDQRITDRFLQISGG